MGQNIFRQLNAEGGMIFRDEHVLEPEFLPEEMPGREREMKELASYLQPAARGATPSSVLLTGPPGTGKTSLARLVLKQLEEVSRKILPLYINCWVCSTRFAILNELIRAQGDMMPRRGIAADELVARLKEIGRREQKLMPIVVLDELDRLLASGEEQILYDLSRSSEALGLPCALIGITNNEEIALKLDPRVRSSLTNHMISFKPYSPTQLKNILSERAKRAFQPNALGDEVIGLCAAIGAKAGGDCRVALQVLLEAGRMAEREGAKQVLVSHVKAVKEQAILASSTPAERKSEPLDEIDKKILKCIKKAGEKGIESGMIYSLLKAGESEQRTIRNHLMRLERSGLICSQEVSAGSGRTKRWRIVRTA